MCREYEARIAELKEQFGQEQADKAKLQQELDRLQKEWEEQLRTFETQVRLFLKLYTIQQTAESVPIQGFCILKDHT